MLITFESEAIVHLISKIPTPKQRINARNKIKKMACDSIDEQIIKHRGVLRELRSESAEVKRGVLAKISKLEQVKLEMEAGRYGF